MIPLDIYKQIYHNKIKNKCTQPFDNKLEAWLALFSMNDPEYLFRDKRFGAGGANDRVFARRCSGSFEK